MPDLVNRWRAVCTQIDNDRIRFHARQAVRLIAVSKTFPASDIRTLYGAGQRDFGENYMQEFAEKTAVLADLPDLVWHVIGHLQSNKSRIVAEKAHWVHTVDRAKIATRLNEQRPASLSPLQVCIEINIAGETAKHGIAADENILLPLAEHIRALPRLRLRGLMCVAAANSNETELTAQFRRMQALLGHLQAAGHDADVLSMGMSGDLDTAIACGATHVRVGSALFGARHDTHKE